MKEADGNGIEVCFVDPDGAKSMRRTRIGRGASLLDAARAAGVAMDATCGARGRCRSCRCKVLSGDVSPATMQDTLQLGHEEVQERFRLACQTRPVTDCEVMALPPKSEAGHKILTGGHAAGANPLDGRAADGAGFAIDSGVRKQVVTASPPREEHRQTSDLAQVLAAVDAPVDRRVPVAALRRIPGELRKQRGELTVTTFKGRIVDVEAGDTTEHVYGMAFDIGTTSIVGTLLHLETGEELAAVGSVNPQTVYGGDLMSRIAYAQFDEKKLVALRAKVLNAINGFIREACASAGVSREHVYKIVVVGNTCMHHIFLGVDVTFVGLAPYAPAVNDGIVVPAGELPLKAAPNAQVCLLPIVAGFVGADTMACVLATRIYESDELRALVDIGTNGEVVMGSKERLMACSAPAGPALEGAQIRHGMRGAMGAIEAVRIDDDVHCSVIGSARAIGICGSGLIDACAKMVGAGVIDGMGRLGPPDRERLPSALAARLRTADSGVEFVLVWDADAGKNEDVTLTQGDIRQLQLAKSAIWSGIVLLQRVMGIDDADLAELMLCGGFGNYISTESAVAIRLLPDVPLHRISYVGNAAHLGAQMALLSERERTRAEELARRIEHVALAARPDFQDIFIDGMSFESAEPIAPRPTAAGTEPRRTAAG
ncbi:MAG: ASKHA domain-containing protein [Chromatiales bacterium]|nr:ASKHA domain-containing protein [Chromatiales bacterium]